MNPDPFAETGTPPALHPGIIALVSSGETSASGGRVFEAVAHRLKAPLRVAVLETPAGFELNSALVAGRVSDYLRSRLQNYSPTVAQIAARRRDIPTGSNDRDALAPIVESNFIYMGAGSPSYAIRHLRNSLAWQLMLARLLRGSALVLASASVIAAGTHTLPVYEIYKVGADPFWLSGLDLPGLFGLELAIISHWNNHAGGTELDTSHCLIGKERFDRLRSRLPASATVVGIDEHTTLLLDLANQKCHVLGAGGVHLQCGDSGETFIHGAAFPIQRLGNFHLPGNLAERIPDEVWGWIEAAEKEKPVITAHVPVNVQALADERAQARAKKDWAQADDLRQKLTRLGWEVIDTPDGMQLRKL